MLDRILLLPYYLTLKVRHSLYNKGIKKSYTAQVPTICVGNITAGGTGKTPHTEMILRMLLDSDEWGAKNLAVLSKGYMRESKGFQQVPVDGSALMFGDEPVQIKKNFPKVTVAVNDDRIEGCDYLCHPEKLKDQAPGPEACWDKEFDPADLIILDDAYQHRKLRASMNIVLVDYNRPLYKDKLIPLGTLRDLPERLYEADIVIITKCTHALDNWEKTAYADAMGYRDYQTSTCTATAPNGRRQLVFFTQIVYKQFRPIYDCSDSRFIYSKRLILFSGIALDTPLENYLSDKYKIVRKFTFPDHHKYTYTDFEKVQKAVQQNPTATLATTEKDAQRVLDFNGLPQELRERMFTIPIEVDFIDGHEREIFRRRVIGLGHAVK